MDRIQYVISIHGTYWCPEGFDFKEDVDDTAISKEGDEP